MKNLLIAVLLLAIPVSAFSQINEVNHFYKKYKRKKDVKNFTIPGFLFRIGGVFAKKYAENEEEGKLIRNLMKRVKGARFMIMEDQNIVKAADYNKMLAGAKSKNKFDDLFVVRDGKTKVNFLIKEGKRGKKKILMFVSEEDTFVMMRLKVKFKKDDLKALIQMIKREADMEDPTDAVRQDQA